VPPPANRGATVVVMLPRRHRSSTASVHLEYALGDLSVVLLPLLEVASGD
jgi:hypothetical protein